MKKIFLIILFQQILFAQAKDPQYIAVEGKATVKVPVEYFLIRITIKNEGQTLSEANKQNKINVLKMFDVLKKHSISDSDFVTKSSETSEASLPSFPRYNKEAKEISVQYSGELVLRNPQIYDLLFNDLLNIPNIDVGVVGFGNFNVEKYKKTAYKEAVLNAKSNAELLLTGTGCKLGKIYKLLQDGRDRYHEYDNIDQMMNPNSVGANYMAMLAPELPSTFKKKYFDEYAEVTIIYAIE